MKKFTLLSVMLICVAGLSQEATVSKIHGIPVNRVNDSAVSAGHGVNRQNSDSKEVIVSHSGRTIAELPNVVNNPKRNLQIQETNSNTISEGVPFASGGRVWNTNTACTEENPNDFTFENGWGCSSKVSEVVANDLTVAANENFTLTNITASLFTTGSIAAVAVTYYSDLGGRPGTLLNSVPSATIVSQAIIGSNFGFNVRELKLTVPPYLFAGQSDTPTKYWIGLSVTDSPLTANVFWVVTSSSSVGSAAAQKAGTSEWSILDSSMDGVYIWEGDCEQIGEGGGGNDDACSEENPNDFTFENGFGCSSVGLNRTANDLTVAAGENFTLTNITASIFTNASIINVAVNYFSNSVDGPGTLMDSVASATIDSQTVIGTNSGLNVIEVKLSVPPFLFAGQLDTPTKYWIELSVTDADSSRRVMWVVTASSYVGSPTMVSIGGSWGVADSVYDGVYIWEGICESMEGSSTFPEPYCGPLNFTNNVEPITLVSVAGINNVTDAAVGGTPAHEDFTNIEGRMVTGDSYPIALEGNTAGRFVSQFVVFIDWNQNGVLDDAGEVYEMAQILPGSTGTDGIQVTGTINVPASASLGTTRMRVKKVLLGSVGFLDPCAGAPNGQAEDYTIRVTQSFTDFVYENSLWTPSDPAGVSTSADNIHIINGTAVFSTDITAYNIDIDSGAALRVEKVLTVAGSITNNGELVFVSTHLGNGELAAVSETTSIKGNATVQRYFKDRRSYRMVSSAVTTNSSIHANWQEGATNETPNPNPGFGTHITGSKTGLYGFDATATGNASMYTVNVATQQFEVIDNTDVDTLTAGKPYLMFVRGDRGIDLTNNVAHDTTVLRARGFLFTGTHTQSFPAGNGEEENFVMFGNPYQSAVDIKTVFANSESINLNTNYYYVYDPTLAGYGGYVTVDLRLENDGTNSSGSVANKYLQPGQAAQVEVFGASTVVFKESNKSPGHFTNSNRNQISESDMLTVQLYTTENFDNGGPVHDSFAILFGEGNDNGLTSEDAVKPMNFYENLGIDHNGTYLSIERREMPQPAEVYPLYSSGYTQSDYTLKLAVEGLEDTNLYLDDHFTGTSTLLEAGDNSYGFSVDASNPLSKATDRFSIRTEQRLGVDNNNLLSNIRLFPNPLNADTFYINAPQLDGEQLAVSINDLTGRRIFERTLECRDNTVAVSMSNNVAAGLYLVTLTHNQQTRTVRLIKE